MGVPSHSMLRSSCSTGHGFERIEPSGCRSTVLPRSTSTCSTSKETTAIPPTIPPTLAQDPIEIHHMCGGRATTRNRSGPSHSRPAQTQEQGENK